MINFKQNCLLLAVTIAVLTPHAALAQVVVSDTLTGATSSYGWVATGGACLTAGSQTTTTTPLSTGNSSLPACVGLPFYNGKTQVGGVSGSLPDPVGSGALRLTNGDFLNGGTNGNGQAGAVISSNPFPTNNGVKVTFSTATYGGNGGTGADGITFMLLDGMRGTPVTAGGSGGSLGYSCSNINSVYDGIANGYVGIGIDEYGNFANPGDNTVTGPGFRTNYVGIRGAGNVNWASLNRAEPADYPSSFTSAQRQSAVQTACRTGTINHTTINSDGDPTTTAVPISDYAMISSPVQLASPIANQQGVNMSKRGQANIITYDLRITSDNVLSLSYSYAGGSATPVITNQSISSVAGNSALPASFLFGFSGGTGGSSNVHEILCFKAAPLNVSSTSAGSNVQQSARVEAGSQVYLSYYHPLNSWGELTASNLVADAQGNVSIASTANWDGNCTLTGGVCATTRSTIGVQSSSARTILSWNGSIGIPFQYSNLAAADATSIGGSTDGLSRLNFLRGDRSNERNTMGVGSFRRRDGVLGDIVNSSPTWVGYPSLSYGTAGSDLLTRSTVSEFGPLYASFMGTYKSRTNVVYTGSNDGMLHGFRSGAYDATGAFSTATTPNDGREVLAFIPQAVVRSIHPTNTSLDFASPSYSHNAYVDTTPGTGDLYYNGAWHTWLVSGLGAGGNSTGVSNDPTSTVVGAMFALDITNPANFSESNAASLVVQEWNSSNLTCTNDSNCKSKFGGVYGTPIIRRMHDGNWAVIFGNGRNSASGAAGIYIMTVDRGTGSTTFRYIDTNSSNLTVKNGIDFVTSADLDGDHVTDYLYAGDSAGNVWRFDVSSATAANWKVTTAPLFTTPNGQPISTRVTVNAVQQKFGAPRILVSFGTGRQAPQTLTSGATYASGTQSLYGIWDWDMTAWNAVSTTQYVALTGAQSITTSTLQSQTITTSTASAGSISGYRTVSQNGICWKGSTACQTGNNKYGWKIDLPASSEQILYSPVVAYGAFIVNTSIPAINQVLSCTSQPASGYTMAISIESGGAPTTSPFATTTTSAGLTSTAGIIAGIGLSATGTPSIVTANGKPFLVQQTVSGVGTVNRFDPPGNGLGKRLTWVKLR